MAMIMKHNLIKRISMRMILAALIAIPIVFYKDFYEHFYAYLSGSMITDVIRNQWHIVAISVAFSIAFFILITFRRKVKKIEKGIVSAFFVSLFVEMYGTPLTIVFASKYFFKPDIILPSNVFEFYFLGVGFGMDVAMAYGTALIILGAALIGLGWIDLYRSGKEYKMAEEGIYSYSRHPQYLGFILMITGWLFGWPTILTVIFVPILVYKYIRLCKTEENEISNEFPEYEKYKKRVPFLV
jgi:methanethiol S-methyltransferase